MINEGNLEEYIICDSKIEKLNLSTESAVLITNGLFNNSSFRISHGVDNYEFNVFYASQFTTDQNNTGNGTGLQKFIELIFLNKIEGISIGFVLNNDLEDSNQSIQNLFDGKELPISTNLQDVGIEMVIYNVCDNRQQKYSSFYSSLNTQKVTIDDFKFNIRNDSTNYQLRLHGFDLELASRQYNDFDHDIVKEHRGEFNPIYDLQLDTFKIDFSIPNN